LLCVHSQHVRACAAPSRAIVFEAIFTIAIPHTQLCARAQIGNPEGVLGSIGSFITGTYLDTESVNDMRSEKRDDGLTYYYYDVYSTEGLNGPHTYTACTVKGDLVLLFSAAANDKQWPKGKRKIETMVQSFRA
jgi:PsbP